MTRIAILPFENLTGDASLDWISAAAPAIVVSELSGSARIAAFRAQTVSDAYLSGATRFVHGYFTGRAGKDNESSLRFTVEVEDSSRHKIVARSSVAGGILDAMNLTARNLSPGAHAFSTSNGEAVAAWARGDDEHAVALDPDFSIAWVDWVQRLAAQGNTTEAIETAQRALDRHTLRSPVDRAGIELAAASLRKDAVARRQALAKLVSLEPADETAARALAQADFNSRDYRAAAAQYRNLLRLNPDDTAAMNSLGYAEAYSADLAAAKKALEQYGQQPNQKTNAVDSLGEAYFVNGNFADAGNYFMAAYQSNRSFLGGLDLLKAAYARWLAGDLKSADSAMKDYLALRAKANDPLVAWREAAWDFTTGRREQAIAKLQTAPPSQKEWVEKQIAVWRGAIPLPNDLAALQQAYQRTEPSLDGQIRTFYAAALFAAGRKQEASALVKLWPLPESAGDPLFQSLVYPEFMQLRQRLN